MFLANNRSAFQHPEFVSQAICELLENDCIIEHSTQPFCANPFSVAKGEKLVFVIDLRHVNNFLVSGFKFKSEDFRSLSQVLEEGRCFLHGNLGQDITMFTSVWSTSLSRFFLAFQWRAEIFYFCSFAFWP